MIGTTAQTGPDRSTEKNATRYVIEKLYEQYCRALDDPLASFAGNWSAQTEIEVDSTTSAEPGRQRASRQRSESIEEVISGVRGLEHFFGPLEKGNSPPAVTLEPPPEILRLFVPPEFKAREARLPSALVRREHHAPGIDSPLFAPRVATQSESNLRARLWHLKCHPKWHPNMP
jgi:hypothetical protein